MKIKRIICIGLMYLVLLSSADFFASADLVAGIPQNDQITVVLEGSHDLSQEFRESIKHKLSEETKSDAHMGSRKPATVWFNDFHLLQYNCYQRLLQSCKPSAKLFIDFGALII